MFIHKATEEAGGVILQNFVFGHFCHCLAVKSDTWKMVTDTGNKASVCLFYSEDRGTILV